MILYICILVVHNRFVSNSHFLTKLSRKPCKHRAFDLPPPPKILLTFN